jgi:hypothetical protein
LKDINRGEDSFVKGMVGSVRVPLQAWLKILWRRKLRDKFNVGFSISLFFSWMMRVFARIAMVFAVEIIFEEGQVCYIRD